jgi:hypothetical protein
VCGVPSLHRSHQPRRHSNDDPKRAPVAAISSSDSGAVPPPCARRATVPPHTRERPVPFRNSASRIAVLRGRRWAICSRSLIGMRCRDLPSKTASPPPKSSDTSLPKMEFLQETVIKSHDQTVQRHQQSWRQRIHHRRRTYGHKQRTVDIQGEVQSAVNSCKPTDARQGCEYRARTPQFVGGQEHTRH